MIVESAVAGAQVVFSWPVILFVVLGTVLGLVFGALPGLGGIVAVALLIPLTVGMDASNAMALFGAAVGGVAFGGSISAILLNIPGTPPNAATCLDGYPMARKGLAGEALGASAVASAGGAIVGLVILVALIPVAQVIVFAFAAPEFFMLTALGISVIAFITRGNFLNGLAAGGLGIVLALIGFDPLTGGIRYNLIDIAGIGIGANYLYDGVKLVPAVVGIFAIGEVFYLIASEDETIADLQSFRAAEGVLAGARAVVAHPIQFLRSAVIGTLVGMVPGVGGSVAGFFAYLAAAQRADDPSTFGEGVIEGVIAPEAANDAKDGGSLVPTLAFGIPGSGITAIILGAFTLHGIAPGPSILTDELDIVFALIIALVVSNVLTSTIGLTGGNYIARLTTIPSSYLIPVILVVAFTGAYVVNRSLGDVAMAFLFGVAGFCMLLFGYSRIALLIGLILGHTAEVTFHRSINAYDAGVFVFVTRPIALVLTLALATVLLYPVARHALTSRRGASE